MDNNNHNHEQGPNDDEVKVLNLDIRDYEFSLNYKPLKNPAELLANLSPLKKDKTLSNEEKIKEVRRIVIQFME